MHARRELIIHFIENINLINIFLKFVVQSIEFKADSLGILTDHPNLVLGI
jgi:exoribonuclease II